MLFLNDVIMPIVKAVKINPIINPPVGDRRIPNPPVKFENTGYPTAPRSMYIIIETVPNFAPSIDAVIKTPNICSVIGIGTIGIEIQAHIEIIATNTPTSTIG